MRGYIFTEAEIECLIEWLRTGEETALTLTTLSRIRTNLDNLSAHIDLMAMVLRKMSKKGRLTECLRLLSELATRRHHSPQSQNRAR